MIDRIVNLNLDRSAPPALIHATQYDNNWKWHFRIFCDGQRWTIPSGSLIFLVGKKPDGHVFAFEGTLTDNEAVVDCDVQMTACAGSVICELRILIAAGKMVAASRIALEVAASPEGNDDVVSNTAITAYAEVLSRLEEQGVITFNEYLEDLEEAFTGYNTQMQAAVAAAEEAKQYAQAFTGAPRTAASAADMTDHDLIYVYTGTTGDGLTNGHWYFWDDTLDTPAWADGGVYNSTAFTTDPTLSLSGKAADAAACGDLKSALGASMIKVKGSYVSSVWQTTQYYSAFVKVTPGSSYYIKPGSRRTTFGGITDETVPPEVGDSIHLSSATGWTTYRYVEGAATDSGVIPNDVTYLYFYGGTTTEYLQMPEIIEINGVNLYDTVFTDISFLAEKAEQNKEASDTLAAVTNKLSTNVENLSYSHPYGIQPFQMSLFKNSKNLFSDFCSHITGRYYGITAAPSGSGYQYKMEIKTSASYQGWLVRVKPNTTYTFGPLDFDINFFTPDLFGDKRVTNESASSPNTITSGPNSYFVSITQSASRDMSEWMMVEGDAYPASYVSGYPQWVNTPKSVTDKTIAFFGDSLTAGSGWTGEADSQGYHQYIHDLYGFTCLNYGYGGSGYCVSYDGTGGIRGTGQPGKGVPNTSGAFTPNNVRTRLAEVTPSELDGVVIFAGTNDWSHQIPLTDFSDELDTVYDYYQNNFGSVPLLVMTPIHRLKDADLSYHSIPLKDYVDIIIQKCTEHGIPYINTFCMSGLQPNNEGNSAVFFPRDDNAGHTIDGIHPNHLAHERIARCIGETLNQIMLWNETAIR